MKFTIPGKPISINHAYGQQRNGRRYLTDEGAAFKIEVGYCAMNAMKSSINVYKYPIKVKIEYYFDDKRRRDIDNGIKLLLDSMTGIVWKDDSEIVCLEVWKDFSDEPRIEVEIEQL
jgi:crossover junction endodeoxyribonuclease RusA